MSEVTKLRRRASILLLSLIGGLITAYAYTVTLDRKLNLNNFTLPAVFPIATVFGLIGGALVSPFLYVCLKGKNMAIAIPSIYALVAVVTAGLNLVASPAGFPGAFVAVIAVLLLWRRLGPNEERVEHPGG